MADKIAVARALRELGMLLEVQGENPFKIRAYENGARALEELPGDLDEVIAAGTLTELPGIGKALAGTRLELVLRPVGFGSQRRLAAGEPVGLVQAASALLRADRPREALAFAQASLAAGDSPQAHKISGEAYRRMGDRNKAIQEYSLYLTMAPDAPDRKVIEQTIAAARKDIPMTQPKIGLE
jgi:tetratricopeptide (TPR) repeat protein